ncbi:TPA: hypothetical protein DIV49_03320 [Candidatus Saccharibacteria bacterium]|nr:hypothetical protein [Candidatus Saccharibacteria bacterium]HRJ91219.1 hypothetical protein [Candidatus Saccharibacteria bacterium]
MELLKTARRRSLVSEGLYIVLNIALAVALLVVVLVVATPWPAFGLVLLSKWRVFAVRSRYWLANIRANLIDAIVGASLVVFLYAATGSLATQIILTILYIVWLLFIKPRSSQRYITLQAAIGLTMGLAAISQVSFGWPSSVVVLMAWVVGYSATRHFLSTEHETHINFLSLAWGFVVAELSWLMYHWSIGYDLPGSLMLSQSTIVIVALSLIAERAYSGYKNDGKIQMNEILLPVLLGVSIIAVVVFIFGGAQTI